MYCPQCGKEQASADVRFCSRCGFQMGVVNELMQNNGLLTPPLAPPMPPPFVPSRRKKGIKTGAILMFISAVLTPIFFAIAIGPADHPGPLIVPLTIFLAGLCRFLYARIFDDDLAPFVPAHPHVFTPPPYRQALPNAEPFRVTNPTPQRINTAEMVEPPSVTDHTTQLFDKE
ncbi:MAG: zinc ribbon domain-containing protein [Acidobacteria bacterium]|nr:zinc ribbon domain-containing protein [Acidobacteriota bacterium]